MRVQLALLLVVAAPVAAFAQQAPVTIHGRVSAADTDAALPRARVAIAGEGEPGSPVYTNDRGEFAIAAPSTAAFALTVVKAGYAAMRLPLKRDTFAAAPARDVTIALTRSAAVNGRIVDTIGETVIGLRVYAERLDADSAVVTGPAKFTTTTDDRGEYRLGGLPPGRYSVTATGAQDPGAVVTLDLRPGDDVSGIGFSALPPRDSAVESSPQPPETKERATIRGRVLTTTDRPIAQAVVNITGPMPPRYFVTDRQGRFTFQGLLPGDYEVRATKSDFLPGEAGQQTAFESSSRIAVTTGARVDNVTLRLSRGLAVSGTIVDRAGEPLQGVSVQALQLSTSGGRRRAALAGALVGGIRETDDRGRYRVLGLQPGTYVIAALAEVASLGGGATVSQTVPFYFPGSASIADGLTVTVTAADVEGIDFTIGDVPTARVTGVALDSNGAPLAGTITLAVSHRSGSIVPTPRTTRIEADGTFAFVNVASGDYVAQAIRIPPFPLPSDLPPDRPFGAFEAREFAAQYVTIGAHDAEPISLRTARGSVLEARLVVDSERQNESIDRIQIETHPIGFDLSPVSASMRFTSAGVRVGARRFLLTALVGPWRFVASGMPEGWYLKSLTINGTDMTDQVIDLGSGASASAEVVISPKGGSIVGRIAPGRRTDRADSAIVFPQDREKWFERSRFIKVVRVSQDGSFRAASLPPGDYYVATTSGVTDEAEATTPEALERLLPRANEVTLDEGDERRLDLSR